MLQGIQQLQRKETEENQDGEREPESVPEVSRATAEQDMQQQVQWLRETVVGMQEAFTRKCRQVGEVKNPVMCFRCKQWGHFARKCPERGGRWCHHRGSSVGDYRKTLKDQQSQTMPD